MELSELLKMGASMIESNSDESTTGLDVEDISSALTDLLAVSGIKGTFDNASCDI